MIRDQEVQHFGEFIAHGPNPVKQNRIPEYGIVSMTCGRGARSLSG